jgi:hypothetical protein
MVCMGNGNGVDAELGSAAVPPHAAAQSASASMQLRPNISGDSIHTVLCHPTPS